jgi:hypothetical protein
MKVTYNRVGGVMVSVLVSVRQILCSNPGSDQTKDYNIDMCCFTNKHEASGVRTKTGCQGNVSEWGDMFTSSGQHN